MGDEVGEVAWSTALCDDSYADGPLQPLQPCHETRNYSRTQPNITHPSQAPGAPCNPNLTCSLLEPHVAMPRTHIRRTSTSLRDPAISILVDEFSQTKIGPSSYTPTPRNLPLQSRNIKNILLVSSAYDLFIFEGMDFCSF